MAERGIKVDHSTLNRWVIFYAPLLEKAFNKKKRRPGDRWRSDETYSVPGVQGKQGCLNEPQVYLKYTNIKAGVKLFASMPGCAGV